VELYQLYKDPDIIKTVKANIIRWLGHRLYSAQMILIPAKRLLLIILFKVKEELEDLLQDG
jgi:hypothetical protein